MQCPSCKEQIDDDSRYCDQCGEQIMVCKECGRPGKGKRCIFDGKEMVAAGSQPTPTPAATVQTTAAPMQPTAAPKPPPQQPQSFAASSSSSDTVKFSGNGIMFEAKDGDIIGRKNGPFAGMFTGQQTVSSTHCKVLKVSGSWHIQDLGSTNGTFVQGNKLAPNAPYPMSSNTAIKVGTLEFMVTFDDDGATIRV
jgi:predicted component of type VI protein secretion system